MVENVQCFYKPLVFLLGAWSLWNNLEPEELENYSKNGHACGDTIDLVGGKPTGAIRVSLGWCSTFKDVVELLGFIQHYFVETVRSFRNPPVPNTSDNAKLSDWSHSSIGSSDISVHLVKHSMSTEKCCEQDQGNRGSTLVSPNHSEITTSDAPPLYLQNQSHHYLENTAQNLSISDSCRDLSREVFVQDTMKLLYIGVLKALCLFPVKSCSAQQVDDWPVGPCGLLFDRHWAISDQRGRVMTLHRYPSMALIRPR